MEAHQLIFSVPAGPIGVTAARHRAVDAIAGWETGLDTEVVDSVGLVISELVTNAVQHGDTGRVSLTVRLSEAVLRIEVCDSSRVLPRLGLPEAYSESGRGLFLVAALADRYGAEPTSVGKRCWAEIALAVSPGQKIAVSPSVAEELTVTPTSTSTPAVAAEVIAVRPGSPLAGAVVVDGSKNAALPLLATAAALDRPVQLNNIPANTDVQIMLALEAVAFPDVSIEFPLFRHGFGVAAGEFGRSVRSR
jgi:anti-sigma regulatory factor (Ser/Thr protein kinase)